MIILFSPHHFVDDAYIALDNLHYLGAYVLINIIRHRDAMLTVLAKLYCSIYGLQEALLVDAGNDEVALVDGFGTFGRGADADGREGMAYTGEEAAFFRECTGVADHGKGIHLKAVVVVETEGLVLDDSFIKFESAGCKAVATAGMAAVEDRHIILLCHFVDGIEEREEVLLGVDVLFSVG